MEEREKMKKILLALFIFIISGVAFSESKIGVGLGIGGTNNIFKKKDNDVLFIPIFDIKYQNFYVQDLNVGYNFYENNLWSTSIYIEPFSSHSLKRKDMKNGYKNIDNRDSQVMGGISFNFKPIFATYGIGIDLHLQGGENGEEGKINLYKPYSAGDKLAIIPTVYLRGFSKDYVDYYFGVSSKERDRSKTDKLDKKYDGKNAWAYGGGILIDYQLRENISISTFAGVEKFSKEISKSPIVKNDLIYIVGTGIKYYF